LIACIVVLIALDHRALEAFIAGPGCDGSGFKCASLVPGRERIIEKSRDLPIEGNSSFEV
jgi:hypothetical protein